MGNRKFVPHPVGADAHIGPLESCEFAEDSRKNGAFCRADVGIGPYIFMFFIEHDYKKAGGSYPPLRVQEQFIGGVPQESLL